MTGFNITSLPARAMTPHIHHDFVMITLHAVLHINISCTTRANLFLVQREADYQYFPSIYYFSCSLLWCIYIELFATVARNSESPIRLSKRRELRRRQEIPLPPPSHIISYHITSHPPAYSVCFLLIHIHLTTFTPMSPPDSSHHLGPPFRLSIICLTYSLMNCCFVSGSIQFISALKSNLPTGPCMLFICERLVCWNGTC